MALKGKAVEVVDMGGFLRHSSGSPETNSAPGYNDGHDRTALFDPIGRGHQYRKDQQTTTRHALTPEFTHTSSLTIWHWHGLAFYLFGSRAGVWRGNCGICVGLDRVPHACGYCTCNITCIINGESGKRSGQAGSGEVRYIG